MSETDIRQTGEGERARILVRERDDYECQACGTEGNPDDKDDLQVHHILPVQSGGSNAVENLALVCNSCHWQIHRRGPDNDGEFPVRLGGGGSLDDSDFVHPSYSLTGCQEAIVSAMNPGETMKREEIVSEVDYSKGEINKQMRNLRIGGIVDRKNRGLYELVEDPRETNE